MSRDDLRPDDEGANQFSGFDPMFGWLPFDPSVAPVNTTPHIAQAPTAAPPEFLDALRNLLTAGSARGPGDASATAPASDSLSPEVDPFRYLNSLLRSGASSDAARDEIQQPRHQLGFDGQTVTLHDREGNSLGAYPGTSGRDGNTDPRARKLGPIPEGDYLLDPTEINEVSGFPQWLRSWTGDWGNFRVNVTPMPGTETHGRSGFFVHGGDAPGSAGCIDVGDQDTVLFPQLRNLEGPVRLRVQYPRQR
jgi:hypothetical protein